MTAPTPEAFLAQPSTDEDDIEHEDVQTFTGVLVDTGDPLESMAASLRTIAEALERPMAVRDAEAADAHGEELRELGQAYDDLEAKHQSLYDLLADVEKIVAKSKSQVSLEVKAAINAWRNPTVDEAPPGDSKPDAIVGRAVQCSSCGRYFADQALLDAHECEANTQPGADASLEEWREYAYLHGIPANDMNRSQIRTALGLPQVAPAAGA